MDNQNETSAKTEVHHPETLPFDLNINGEYTRNAAKIRVISEEAFEGATAQTVQLDQCTGIQILREKTRAAANTKVSEVNGRTVVYRGRTEYGRTEAGEPYICLLGRFRNGETIRVNGFGANEAVLKGLAENSEVSHINVQGTPFFSRADRRAAYQAADASVAAKLQGQKSIKVERLEVVYKDGKKERLIELPNMDARVG